MDRKGEKMKFLIKILHSNLLAFGIILVISLFQTPNLVAQHLGQQPAADSFTIVLHADKDVWTWGRDDFGQLGDGTVASPENNPTPGKVGYFGPTKEYRVVNRVLWKDID